jgi:ribosomal protein L7/L12
MFDAGGPSSLLTLLLALFVGYVLGRTHASLRDPRRVDEKKRTALAAAQSTQDIVRRMPPDVRSNVERLIAEGKLIEAIRDVRSALNIGLKEAKNAVEEIRRKTGSKSARAP